MSNSLHLTNRSAHVWRLLSSRFLLASTLGAISVASAQTVTPPTTPTGITPPAGNTAFLVGHADGSQGYTCLPTSTGGTSWTINPARPEATLFTNIYGLPFEIITHFASINENPTEGVVPPLSGMQPGRVPSTAAGCGQKRRGRWSLARTTAAPTVARFPASCWNPSGTRRGRLAVDCWLTPPLSNGSTPTVGPHAPPAALWARPSSSITRPTTTSTTRSNKHLSAKMQVVHARLA
jgi:hypothetical protein